MYNEMGYENERGMAGEIEEGLEMQAC